MHVEGRTCLRAEYFTYIKNILNSCPTQGRVEGWDAMKPLDYRSVSSKGAGRPRLTLHHKGWWNETKWMRWVWRNGGMKFMVGENGSNPEKNLPRPRFVHHETHMEWPRRELGTPAVGGERLTACATRPPLYIHILFFSIIGVSFSNLLYCTNFSVAPNKFLMNIVRNHISRLYPVRWIVRYDPVSRTSISSDQTPLDFYLWRQLKRILSIKYK